MWIVIKVAVDDYAHVDDDAHVVATFHTQEEAEDAACALGSGDFMAHVACELPAPQTYKEWASEFNKAEDEKIEELFESPSHKIRYEQRMDELSMQSLMRSLPTFAEVFPEFRDCKPSSDIIETDPEQIN